MPNDFNLNDLDQAIENKKKDVELWRRHLNQAVIELSALETARTGIDADNKEKMF